MAPYTRIHPIRPALMAEQCRKLAADLRREHAMGGASNRISRADAARNMDAQAERWEAECKTGILNVVDRRKCVR